MVNKVSTWGVIAALAYLGFVGALFMYVSDCREMFCEAGVLLAILPWFPLFDVASLPVDGYALFWFFVFFDTLLLYFLFAALQKWVKKKI